MKFDNNRSENYEYVYFDMYDFINRCFRSLHIIIVVAIACAAIAYIVTAFMIEPKYSASADMIVNNKPTNDVATITNQDLQASSSLVETCSVILKSHKVIEDIIEEQKLPYTYSQLASNVSVKAVDETQVMRISVTDTDPDRALKIVTAFVDIVPDVIMDAIDAGSVKNVDTPWTTGTKVSPNITKNVVAGGAVGVAACLVVIFFRMIFDNKFKSERDIKEVLNLPILAIIPLEKDSDYV